ncbi:MAG: ImuA family protein [Planctomycetia bacterium]
MKPAMKLEHDVERSVVPSGFEPLDRLLPRGGVPRGSLLEWLCDDDVSGAATLACAVAVSLAGGTAAGGTILIVDRCGRFHPPSVMPWLMSPASDHGAHVQCVVVRPARDDDEAWAIDQALRCPGVSAVLAWPRRIHPTAMRRWQLAARSSQSVGLLVRPGRARREPSWAMHRIAVAPAPAGASGLRRMRLSLLDGPWSIEGMSFGHAPAERSVEIMLDLSRGREAVGGHVLPGVPRHLQRPMVPQRGVACRAS